MSFGEMRRVVAGTVRDAVRDDVAGEAAEMAYFFLLSLFPVVLILFALTGLVGGDETFVRLTAAAERMVPPSAWQLVHELIGELADRERPGMLSIGTDWGLSCRCCGGPWPWP